MRACLSLAVICLLQLPCATAHADSVQQPLSLQTYRVKAALPAICTQVGGTILYGSHAQQCKLPTATSKIPQATAAARHALPVSIRH
jgi:hypothetical protein